MKILKVNDVKFEMLIDQDASVINKVREIRNRDSIRKNMYSDHLITEEEHDAWVGRLRASCNDKVMVIKLEGRLVGLVALRNIRHADGVSDWAFYLDDDMQGKGLGSIVEYKLLQMAFFEMNLFKLNCEVLETNASVVRLHKKFGFVVEGFRRAHVLKDGKHIGVHLLGILASEWVDSREKFSNLFEN
jgi:UDP-4-amino-4,6-dideoxy-N-acetyl-beta-L-altrosamine N-acetyltransferase